MKLFASFPFCVTLENPVFHLSLLQSIPLASGGPPVLRKDTQMIKSLVVLSPIASNDEGSMFLKYFTVNRETTSMLFLYLFSLSNILSSLSKLVSVGDGLKTYLTSLLHSILYHTDHPNPSTTISGM